MGFFDRLFGKKKEELPSPPKVAYVPPKPPTPPSQIPSPVVPEAGSAPSSSSKILPVFREPDAPSEISRATSETPSERRTGSPIEPPPEPTFDAFDGLEEPEFLTQHMPAAVVVDEPPAPSSLSDEDEDEEIPPTLVMKVSDLREEIPRFRTPEPILNENLAAASAETVREVQVAATVAPEPALATVALSPDASPIQVAPPPVAEEAQSVTDGAASFANLLSDDEDIDGFDAAFDALLVQKDDGIALEEEAEPAVEFDQTEIRRLFADIAANYMRPVRAFMLELRTGSARKEWVEICQPAIGSLGKSALGMGMEDVSEIAGRFEGLLGEARALREGTVNGDLRDRLLSLYDQMTEILPSTFALSEEGMQSEAMIVNSLLKQIPEVGKVTIDKLYRAGLLTLESFIIGAKEDIAVATGLPIWLAERIVEKFKAYHHELESAPVQSGFAAQRGRLERLCRELKEFHEAYEQSTSEEVSNPSATEDRRFYRQARQDTQLQINVVLAELGAVSLVHEIQRLSFEKRIERLKEYIASLASEEGR